MNDYQLTSEVYTLPNKEGKNILYFPLAGLLVDSDDSFINLISDFEDKNINDLTETENQHFKYLIEKGIISKKGRNPNVLTESVNDVPYKLTLFPTNKCNLECIYCYASKNRSKPVLMKWEIFESAIEYYINLMLQENRKIFTLELHGGGEPLQDWDLLQKMIHHVEKKCSDNDFKLEVVTSTNGVLSRDKLEWIVKHFSFLLVSFDVLPDIQNMQRPFPNQKATFQVVDETIKYFDEVGFPYEIRVTVTSNNESLLKETIDFVHDQYKTKSIYFGPVRAYGNNNSFREIDFHKFIYNFKMLESYALNKGIRIRFSRADHEKCSSNFCYVGTSQFAVTPDGYLTNCWEVTDKNHPLADIFIFGKLKANGILETDNEKYSKLKSFCVDNLKYCQNCFAKWHCSGGCAARLYVDGIENSRGDDRCFANRELIAHKLLQNLK